MNCNFLEVYASVANDFRVRTKRGKQHYWKKRKQIRYLNIFNIINVLALLSADAKSAIHLRVPLLTKVEVRNFPLLHFPRWFCLVNGQLAMSLWRMKRSVICKFQSLPQNVPCWRQQTDITKTSFLSIFFEILLYIIVFLILPIRYVGKHLEGNLLYLHKKNVK